MKVRLRLLLVTAVYGLLQLGAIAGIFATFYLEMEPELALTGVVVGYVCAALMISLNFARFMNWADPSFRIEE